MTTGNGFAALARGAAAAAIAFALASTMVPASSFADQVDPAHENSRGGATILS